MELPESASFAAEKVILRWDSSASEDARDKMIFTGDRHEIDRYLDAVDKLQKPMSYANLSDYPSSSVLQIAMARLEDEFRNILLSHTSPIEAESLTESTHPEFVSQEFELKDEIGESSFEKQFEHQESNSSTTSSYYKSTSNIREVDLFPNEAVYDLQCIVERMIASGYLWWAGGGAVRTGGGAGGIVEKIGEGGN